MSEAVYPSLDTVSFTTNPEEIIVRIFQFFLSVPKNAFATPELRDMTGSFMDIVSRNTMGSMESVKIESTDVLTKILQNQFVNNQGVQMTVNLDKIDDSNRYNVSLDAIVVIGGTPYRASRKAYVDTAGQFLAIDTGSVGL